LIDFEVHVKKENANLVIKYGLYRLINAVFGLTQVKMKTKKKKNFPNDDLIDIKIIPRDRRRCPIFLKIISPK